MILIKLVLAAVGSFEYVPQWTGREKFRLDQNDQYYIKISRTLLELVNCWEGKKPILILNIKHGS